MAESRVRGGCSLVPLGLLFAVALSEPPGYSARPRAVMFWFGVDGVGVPSAPLLGQVGFLDGLVGE